MGDPVQLLAPKILHFDPAACRRSDQTDAGLQTIAERVDQVSKVGIQFIGAGPPPGGGTAEGAGPFLGLPDC